MKRWIILAFVWGVAALFAGYAWGQDGPVALDEKPTLSNPSLTFKMERNSLPPGGQEFIRFTEVSGVHKVLAEGSTTVWEVAPQTGTRYQRMTSIDSIQFDHLDLTSALESAIVKLKNGEWFVVTGSCEENWQRFSEAGGHQAKPSKGLKEE
jgi:hypothetical protein